MNKTIEKLILRSDKKTLQSLVYDNSIERLGYIHNDIIEDEFKVKKGTCEFGITVSNLFEEYRIKNKVLACELEAAMRNEYKMYKNSISPDKRREHGLKYNQLVEMHTELIEPTTRFVKAMNKVLKNKNKVKKAS